MIAFVDDELRYIRSYVDELRADGFEVVEHSNLDEASKFFQENGGRAKLLVLDIMVPPGRILKDADTQEGTRSGLRFYKLVRRRLPSLPVVILTNASDPEVEETFLKERNCRFRRKSECLPFELAELVMELISDRRGQSDKEGDYADPD